MTTFDLSRFEKEQRDSYAIALREITNGLKVTHWMWFIFPQLAGLGHSTMSRTFAIAGLEEARAYLADRRLGPRLTACAQAVLAVEGRTATEIFGTTDAAKLRSCATLFAAVTPAGSVFDRVLEKCFDGSRDELTLRALSAGVPEM